MTSGLPPRFEMPVPGPPALIAFPPIARHLLDNGLGVWAVEHTAVPLVTIVVTLDGGASADPAQAPGLASLTAALLNEGAGGRDAIEMSDALARLGTHLEVDTGSDVTTLALSAPVRHFADAMTLLASAVRSPNLDVADFERLRELRQSRLRQASLTPAAPADRTLITEVFGAHPYGHGTLGTTRALDALTVDDVRAFWSRAWTPARATVMVCGDVPAAEALTAVRRAFGDWHAASGEDFTLPAPVNQPADAVLVIDRPGAPQSEIRIGHLGPPRRTPDYHALVVLNAIAGGIFTSRLNRNLREARAITYGARSSFDFRRAGGLFACDTSVQADATAIGVAEILRELDELRGRRLPEPAELDRAKSSLTRGYVRQFETSHQLARGLVMLASSQLDEGAFDRFVPEVERITRDDLERAALAHLHPAASTIVVVGDLEREGKSLEALGRPVTIVTPEF